MPGKNRIKQAQTKKARKAAQMAKPGGMSKYARKIAARRAELAEGAD